MSSEDDSLNLSITDLVSKSGCSIRLLNVIKEADAEGSLPHVTLRDYYKDGVGAYKKYRKFPRMGKKSTAELRTLLDNEINRRNFEYDMGYKKDSCVLGMHSSIADIVMNSGASVRLSNAIMLAKGGNKMPHVSLQEFVDKKPNSIKPYYSLPNLGRKSVKELEFILEEAVSLAQNEISKSHVTVSSDKPPLPERWSAIRDKDHSKLLLRSYLVLIADAQSLIWPEELSHWKVSDCIGYDYSELEDTIKDLCSSVATGRVIESIIIMVSALGSDVEEVLTRFQFSQLVPFILKFLTERQKSVISRRYGLGGSNRQTLEEVGSAENVTRERIRQIEKKALTKLKLPQFVSIFQEIIRIHEPVIRSLFLGQDECGELGEILDTRKLLPCKVRLAFDLIYPGKSGLKQYLDKNYARIDKIYFPRSRDTETLEKDIKRLEVYLDKFKLPRTIAYLSNHFDIAGFAVSVLATRSKDFGCYKGYLYKGQLSIKKRRIVNLHRCALDHFGGMVKDFFQLLDSYLYCFPEDTCSDRDLRIVMAENPQLFVDMTDAGYWAVSRQIPIRGSDLPNRSDVPRQGIEVIRPKNEESLRFAIASILEDMGPSPLNIIKERFVELYGHKWSANSVFPILVESPYFVRMAPGIMGTLSMLYNNQLQQLPTGLFSATQIRIYVLAQYSNSRILYPLWNPKTEYAWCRWGSKNITPKLFNSLLSVVKPALWPIPEKEREKWLQLSRDQGLFEVEVEPKPIDSVIPTVRRTLAIAQYCQQFTNVSWMDLNRVIGARQDDRNILSYVSVLHKLGIVRKHSDWKKPLPINTANALWFINEVICNDAIGANWSIFCEKLSNRDNAVPDWCSKPQYIYLMSLLADQSDKQVSVSQISSLDQMLAELQEEELLADIGN